VVGVARDMQAKYPHVFGKHGGSSRVFSMTEVAYSLGMMLGPLLSGILFETIGFSLMAIVFGTCYHLQHTEFC
jgi:MFS family permease